MSKATGCQCNDCGKVFGRKGDLNRHKRIHSGERPYVCAVCQKGFTQGTALKTHANIHTKKKPHKCGLGGCTAAFGDPSSCSRHRREKHNGIQGFRCPVPECRTQIKRRSSFVAHLRKHKIRALTKEEITQMAVESSAYESPSPELLTMHKEEEEPVTLPPPSGYTFDSNMLSDEFGRIRPQNSTPLSDAPGSPCSSPLSLASCSLDGCSSSSSPGPQDPYQYGGYLPTAPMQVLDYGSSTYQDAVGAPSGYTSFDPYIMDGYVSGGSSSASSTSPSASPHPIPPYTIDSYSSMCSTMPGNCGSHVSYEYQGASVPSDWSHPPSGGFAYVSDDCSSALGMRY